MSIPNEQASDALKEIERTGRRSATAYRYNTFSPHLILWGVIWIIGYVLSFTHPQWWPTWPVLVVAGSGAGFAMGRRHASEGSREHGWRFGASFLAVAVFFVAVFAIIPNIGPRAGAFFPLFVALGYALAGIWWLGARMIVLAAGLGALTLVAYFWVPQYFLLCMAAVGGGGLILGGIWLREV